MNGNTLLDLFQELDGMQPVIFAIDTPPDYEEFYKIPNCVVLDIDSSYAKISSEDGPMPPFHKEIELLKFLNIFKNRKKTTYCQVNPSETTPSECDEANMVVM